MGVFVIAISGEPKMFARMASPGVAIQAFLDRHAALRLAMTTSLLP